MISLRTGSQGDGAKIFDFPAYCAAVREPFLLRLGGSSLGWRARRGWGILDPSRVFAERRMLALACSGLNASFQGGTSMEIRRRNFLFLAGVAASASAMPKVGKAQAPAGPKLTQIARKDLEGQDRQVQESVVSLVEFAPSTAAPWHMHPGAQEILYTIQGNLVVEIEGQGTMTVKTGECSIIPADIPHLARNDSNSTAAKALVVHSRSAKDKPLVVPVKRAI